MQSKLLYRATSYHATEKQTLSSSLQNLLVRSQTYLEQ